MELALSEQRWQFALEGSGNGVWDWNVGNERVFYSRTWKEIIGVEYDNINETADEWVDRIHPNERNAFIDAMQNIILGKNLKFYNEHRVQTKTGDYKWVSVKGMTVERLHNGTPSRIIGTMTDIQLQKDTLEQLHHMLEISSDQNKRLLNFAHIISHNLRSHSGNFELLFSLMDSSESDEDKKDIIERIRLVSKRLAETITNLNEIVSVQSNTNIWKASINLKGLVNRVIRGLNGQLSSTRANVILDFEDSTVVKGNEAYLESIFLNLLTNCIKYRSNDRVLEIKISAENVVKECKLLFQIMDLD
ncbi:MAG: PAS domain-containing protein [Flavobacteriales bacterium]